MGEEKRDSIGEVDVRLARKCWREVVSGVVLVPEEPEDTEIVKASDFQGLPPDPVEEVKSNIRLSQAPNSLGIETTTTGTSGETGGETVML
jgi:hypothetical protein